MALHSHETVHLYRLSGVVNIVKLVSVDGLGKENDCTHNFDIQSS